MRALLGPPLAMTLQTQKLHAAAIAERVDRQVFDLTVCGAEMMRLDPNAAARVTDGRELHVLCVASLRIREAANRRLLRSAS